MTHYRKFIGRDRIRPGRYILPCTERAAAPESIPFEEWGRWKL